MDATLRSAPIIEYTVGETLADIDPLIAKVNADAAAAGVNDDDRYAVQVCLEEVIANLVLHGVPRAAGKAINVVFSVRDGRPALLISDGCQPYDSTPPPEQPNPDPARIGGKGIRLLHAFTRDMRYWSEGPRNFLELHF